jgi:hypothetical protein
MENIANVYNYQSSALFLVASIKEMHLLLDTVL